MLEKNGRDIIIHFESVQMSKKKNICKLMVKSMDRNIEYPDVLYTQTQVT